LLRNCVHCGVVFVDRKSNICSSCVESEKGLIETIKTYISTHRRATPLEIVRDTGVDYVALTSMIKDGRLRTLDR
jgi:hypothetical protein